MPELQLLSSEESALRAGLLRRRLSNSGADAMLVCDNATIYYLTGRVFAGYIYLPTDAEPIYFVRRPVGLKGAGVEYIRKPESMAQTLGSAMPHCLALELDVMPYSFVERIKSVFAPSEIVNASAMIREARACKTAEEIRKIEHSGVLQERVYRRVPHLYKEGMTDLELQVEIERVSRLEGCLGQFRISGNSMELYMGNVLAGENADVPTPYDFAMGGEGLDPSLPVGCSGMVIKPGQSVMVDVNGNYTGYMTDMTRTFSVGRLTDEAIRAHRLSIDICRELSQMARPGVLAKNLFERAEAMAREAGLYDYFMGHRQKAGFVGHGLGIEINELPVIAPRSRDVIAAGNVIAFEPKFVIPHVGAVGIENTYVVEPDKTRCLTNAPEEVVELI